MLWSTGSRLAGFSSCGEWAQYLWRTGLVVPRHVDLPGPEIKPVSPALAGRFLTAMPPGKPPRSTLVWSSGKATFPLGTCVTLQMQPDCWTRCRISFWNQLALSMPLDRVSLALFSSWGRSLVHLCFTQHRASLEPGPLWGVGWRWRAANSIQEQKNQVAAF